jgi:hypothetical protein
MPTQDPDKRRASNAAYYQSHKAERRAYYQANRERLIAACRERDRIRREGRIPVPSKPCVRRPDPPRDPWPLLSVEDYIWANPTTRY